MKDSEHRNVARAGHRSGKTGPEKPIQVDLENFLRARKWYVKRIHGSMYQSGLPDIYACHKQCGQRWIEVKDPNRSGNIFTDAQLKEFPIMCEFGAGVWVLTAATEMEYKKLFSPPNWYLYLNVIRG